MRPTRARAFEQAMIEVRANRLIALPWSVRILAIRHELHRAAPPRPYLCMSDISSRMQMVSNPQSIEQRLNTRMQRFSRRYRGNGFCSTMVTGICASSSVSATAAPDGPPPIITTCITRATTRFGSPAYEALYRSVDLPRISADLGSGAGYGESRSDAVVRCLLLLGSCRFDRPLLSRPSTCPIERAAVPDLPR